MKEIIIKILKSIGLTILLLIILSTILGGAILLAMAGNAIGFYVYIGTICFIVLVTIIYIDLD